MRLLCIETPLDPEPGYTPIIRVGRFYNTIDRIKIDEKWFYELEEHEGFAYHESLFIPCSSERVEEERMDVIYH
jgi:hypothetical protein